jgi:Ca2+-binding EF-hand superfamily protein
MKVPTLLSASVLTLVCSWAAVAADAVPKTLDPDSDGTVSLAEAQAAGAKVFATLNKDADKTLDAKELGDRIDAAGIKAADPDNDGTIDEKEYAKIIESKFKAADPDGDGTLDAKELDSAAGKALLKLIQ